MQVSVVIPTLNEAPNIQRAVQTTWQGGADEIIVVDGGSQDDTCEIARDSGCQVLHAERASRGLQLNLGTKQARGDAVLFLHADTWLDRGGISQMRTALAEAAVMGGAFRQRIDARGLPYRLLEWANGQRVRCWGMAYGDQGIFLRRSFLEQLGGVPEIPLMEDIELMRAFLRHARPRLLPGPIHVSPRRWQRNGVVRQTLRNFELRARYRRGVPPEELARDY
jgi:rSAM/selenodomain-associated transferase 2